MPARDHIGLLYEALGQPIGLLISTNDPARARAQLYAARQAAQDPELAILQFRISPLEGGELVICKGLARGTPMPGKIAEPYVPELPEDI